MAPFEAALLRLLPPFLLLLPMIACPEGDSALPPPFPPRPMVSTPAPVGRSSPFQVEPYLQLGSGLASPDRLALLWQARDGAGDWLVEVQPQSGGAWTRMAPPVSVLLAAPGAGSAPHRVWTATLEPLEPGLPFEYRILQDGTEVFRAEAMALKGPGQPQQVVVAGDLAGPDWPDDGAMLRQIHQQNPDLMVAAGDLVPPQDSLDRYRRSLFSRYNAGQRDPRAGAPFMRSTLLVCAPGDSGPAGRLAYQAYWDQPRGGAEAWSGQVHGLPPPAQADGRFPVPGGFSFPSGDVHWTVLDSGRAAHWDDPGRRAWLARDLAGAQAARWRFVVFRRQATDPAPGGRDDGGMGSLWPLFQQYRVAIVFTGHRHPYQRTQMPAGAGSGPILVATGAACPERQDGPAQRTPSVSLLDITASRVDFRQIDGDGAAFDHFTLKQ